ncbi:MAG: UDP-N-acetyl glucosamine 2-epimerase [Acidipila sp.]|nr:UDP-N-acetyl glucosamine 2-epimerase [Acidipila sp.]
MALTPNPRLLLIAGARPNFVKLAALVSALAAPTNSTPQSCATTLLVHTGQHYDDALSRLLFDQLGLPRADVNLEVGSGTHGAQTGLVMERLEPVVMDWKPDAVVVVGDVNSTLAAALVAAKLHIPVAHVEAGLRSFDRTMPEEINRVLTDDLATWLFVSEPSGVVNLRLEGHPEERIHLVGNVMIDSLQRFLPAAKRSGALADYDLIKDGPGGAALARPFVLVTLHRPSNVDRIERLAPLAAALAEIGRRVPVLFPAHPRTAERLRAFGLAAQFDFQSAAPAETHSGAASGGWDREGRGVRLVPALGYLEFLHLMSSAACVLTDSGGIQEETTALGVPCLTLRESTERPITVDEGTNTIVGLDPARILSAAGDALSGRSRRGGLPPLWDGHAGERIVSILLKDLRAQDFRGR